MISAYKNITIDRGSRKTFKIRLNFDIGSATIKVVIYKDTKSTTPILTAIPTPITGEANTYLVTLSSMQTSLLTNDKYIWGIKLEHQDGNYDLILKGEVDVSWGLP